MQINGIWLCGRLKLLVLHRVFAVIYTLYRVSTSPCKRARNRRVKHTRQFPATSGGCRHRVSDQEAESPGSRPGFPPGRRLRLTAPDQESFHLLSMSAWISSITCSFWGEEMAEPVLLLRNSRTGRVLGLAQLVLPSTTSYAVEAGVHRQLRQGTERLSHTSGRAHRRMMTLMKGYSTASALWTLLMKSFHIAGDACAANGIPCAAMTSVGSLRKLLPKDTVPAGLVVVFAP